MLHDGSVLDKLHLTLTPADASSIPPEEEIVLEKFYNYVVELCSARAWSQCLLQHLSAELLRRHVPREASAEGKHA